MLIVYGRKSSANVQKVRWICNEGNLEFKTEIVGGKHGGLMSPEFKRLKDEKLERKYLEVWSDFSLEVVDKTLVNMFEDFLG